MISLLVCAGAKRITLFDAPSNTQTFIYICHISVASHVYGNQSPCKGVTYALLSDGRQLMPVVLYSH